MSFREDIYPVKFLPLKIISIYYMHGYHYIYDKDECISLIKMFDLEYSICNNKNNCTIEVLFPEGSGTDSFEAITARFPLYPKSNIYFLNGVPSNMIWASDM
jgi:hypothetical protein